MSPLIEGDTAPHFTLPSAGGNTVSLSDYLGRKVIVYFYPAAMSPGCTTESCDFRDSFTDFSVAGVSVLGISPDPVEKLEEFAKLEALNFPLASDPTRETMGRWGVLGEKVKNGVTSIGVIRSTFIVGADGLIERVFRDVAAQGHVAEVRAALDVTS